MERITEKALQSVVDRINRIADTPAQPYVKQPDGKYKPQAHCYHLDFAYGGVQLVQMSSREGCSGTRNVLGCGHVTKRDLYDRMQAFISGMDAVRSHE